MRDSYIIDGTRTPIGSFGGTLSAVRADDLAAHVIKALMDKHPELDKGWAWNGKTILSSDVIKCV